MSASYFLKLEISLDTPDVFLVARGHLCTVLLDHVRFEIDGGAEHDKLAGETL